MRKHVLVVVSSFPVYSETFVVDHVKGMLESGWEVSVVAKDIDRKLFDVFFAGEASRPELLTFFTPSRLLREGVVTLAGKAFEGIECHPVPGSLNAEYKCTDFYAPEDDRSIYWANENLAIAWSPSREIDLLVSRMDSEGVSLDEADLYVD